MTRTNRTAKGGTAKDAPQADEHRRDEVEEASLESMDASDPPAFSGISGVGAGSPADEKDERQQRVAARAHELWRAAGSPEGVALDFWLQAEREINGGSTSQGSHS